MGSRRGSGSWARRRGAAGRAERRLVRPPLVDGRALHREYRRRLCRRRHHGDRAERRRLHRRGGGQRQSGGARGRSPGQDRRPRLQGGARQGRRGGRGAQATLANLEATRRLRERWSPRPRPDRGGRCRAYPRQFDLVRYRQLAPIEFASAQRLQQADADHKKAARRRRQGARRWRPPSASSTSSTRKSSRPRRRLPRRRPTATSPSSTSAIPSCARRSTAPSATAAPGPAPLPPAGAQLMSLVPARGLWVDANFKESQLARHAPRPAGRDPCRCAAGRGIPGPCRQPGAGDRCQVQRAAGRERDRQFHQDRAARAGPHPARRRCLLARPAAAGLSVTAIVDQRAPP